MEIEGDYQRDGYALTRGMVPRGVARALMARLRADLPPGPITPQPQPASKKLRSKGDPKPVNLIFAESPTP
ncbi:MAG: hypothetical protein V4696_11940 [Pseudomonadota bacterium]